MFKIIYQAADDMWKYMWPFKKPARALPGTISI